MTVGRLIGWITLHGIIIATGACLFYLSKWLWQQYTELIVPPCGPGPDICYSITTGVSINLQKGVHCRHCLSCGSLAVHTQGKEGHEVSETRSTPTVTRA